MFWCGWMGQDGCVHAMSCGRLTAVGSLEGKERKERKGVLAHKHINTHIHTIRIPLTDLHPQRMHLRQELHPDTPAQFRPQQAHAQHQPAHAAAQIDKNVVGAEGWVELVEEAGDAEQGEFAVGQVGLGEPGLGCGYCWVLGVGLMSSVGMNHRSICSRPSIYACIHIYAYLFPSRRPPPGTGPAMQRRATCARRPPASGRGACRGGVPPRRRVPRVDPLGCHVGCCCVCVWGAGIALVAGGRQCSCWAAM